MRRAHVCENFETCAIAWVGRGDTDEKRMIRLNGEMLETLFVVGSLESSNSFRLRERWEIRRHL